MDHNNNDLPKPPQNGVPDPNRHPACFNEELAENGVCALKKKKTIIHRDMRDEAMYGYMCQAYAKWAAPFEAVFKELERIATSIDLMVSQFGMEEMDKMPQDETSKSERSLMYELLLKGMAEAFKSFMLAVDPMRLRELYAICCQMFADFNPTLVAVREYLQDQGAGFEKGECMFDRMRWLLGSARDCVKMATEMERRNQLFDCSGALRTAITLMRRELGWTVREEYCRKFYTLPAISNCYLRKMRGECICTEGCKRADSGDEKEE